MEIKNKLYDRVMSACDDFKEDAFSDDTVETWLEVPDYLVRASAFCMRLKSLKLVEEAKRVEDAIILLHHCHDAVRNGIADLFEVHRTIACDVRMKQSIANDDID